MLEVLDGATNTYVGSVSVGSPDFNEVGGVAVNPTTNTIYVANSYSGTLAVIDGATNAIGPSIPVGDRPSAVAVNPATNSVYITVSASASGGAGVVVLNGATNQSPPLSHWAPSQATSRWTRSPTESTSLTAGP